MNADTSSEGERNTEVLLRETIRQQDARVSELFAENQRLKKANKELAIIVQALCCKLENDPDIKL